MRLLSTSVDRANTASFALPAVASCIGCVRSRCQEKNTQSALQKLFFLTHDDDRAPAAAAPGEGRKSARALRRMDSWTRSTDLDVLVCIATDKTSLLCQNSAVEFHHSTTPRWHRPSTDRRGRNPLHGHNYDMTTHCVIHTASKCPQVVGVIHPRRRFDGMPRGPPVCAMRWGEPSVK